MPRKSNTDMIATLEAKLAEAKAKQIEKDKATITKLHERRALLVQREEKIAAQILEVDEMISELVVQPADEELTFDSVEIDEV